MKKIFYLFLILSLAFGLQSCGGSGGSADDPEPGPEPGATKAKVSFALKSDINGVQDNDLKTALTHLRLYLYDKDQKLVSVNKYTSADALKAIELEKGNYTVVLVGNVPEDGNISSETIGTPLSGMSVQLTKAEGATHYTPLGDVMFAKSTLTVDRDRGPDILGTAHCKTHRRQRPDGRLKRKTDSICHESAANRLFRSDFRCRGPRTRSRYDVRIR